MRNKFKEELKKIVKEAVSEILTNPTNTNNETKKEENPIKNIEITIKEDLLRENITLIVMEVLHGLTDFIFSKEFLRFNEEDIFEGGLIDEVVENVIDNSMSMFGLPSKYESDEEEEENDFDCDGECDGCPHNNFYYGC